MDHPHRTSSRPEPDLNDVRGLESPKRALEIAAAGGHSLALLGPRGAGKTMLARRLPGILPPLNEQEALESFALLREAGQLTEASRRPPVRAPHHNTTHFQMFVRPHGDFQLSTHGVLLLDPAGAFSPDVKIILRNFMTKSQDGGQIVSCWDEPWETDDERLILVHDLVVELQVASELEMRSAPGEPSATVAARVAPSRQAQLKRQNRLNTRLEPEETLRRCSLDDRTKRLFDHAQDRLGLDAQNSQRILTVARTIADLHAKSRIQAGHLAEAIAYSPRSQLRQPGRP